MADTQERFKSPATGATRAAVGWWRAGVPPYSRSSSQSSASASLSMTEGNRFLQQTGASRLRPGCAAGPRANSRSRHRFDRSADVLPSEYIANEASQQHPKTRRTPSGPAAP